MKGIFSSSGANLRPPSFFIHTAMRMNVTSSETLVACNGHAVAVTKVADAMHSGCVFVFVKLHDDHTHKPMREQASGRATGTAGHNSPM